MDELSRINSLLKEADVYQYQGLLAQSKEKYETILNTIQISENLSGNQDLLHRVQNKIRKVQDAIEEVDRAPDTIQLSEEVQSLITKLFSFSKNSESAAVEGAVALATFGQYEKALDEFRRLLDEGIMPLTVAKNLLRCHLSLGQPEMAVSQFEDWCSQNSFSGGELIKLRDFLQLILEREGIQTDLPEVEVTSLVEEVETDADKDVFSEDIFGIISVRIIFNNEFLMGSMRDFDVIFQFGNAITFEVNGTENELLDYFEPGVHLSRVQCYADFFLFNARGVISEKREITTGPKKGLYSIVLTLESP